VKGERERAQWCCRNGGVGEIEYWGGGLGLGLGEKKCQREGGIGKMGMRIREHGEREPREKKELGGTDGAF